MRRRGAPPATVAVFVAAACLLLSACGGSEGEGDSRGADGTEGAGEVSPSPSASASEARRDPPEITLPSYARNEFEGQVTGDPKKDAVLADNAERINSIDDAIFKGTADTKALSYYSSGEALLSAKEFIRRYVDDGEKWAGTTRYFDREVTFRDDGSAAVVYCADESQSWITQDPEQKRDIADGPGPDDAYVLYNTRLEQNEKGVWRTVKVVGDRGADQCVA